MPKTRRRVPVHRQQAPEGQATAEQLAARGLNPVGLPVALLDERATNFRRLSALYRICDAVPDEVTDDPH